MTYALAWPLQEALYDLLAADATVAGFVGARIYDAPPAPSEGSATGPYLTLGDEVVEAWSTKSDRGAKHTVAVSVHAEARGFAEAKRCAGAVADALIDVRPSLSRGAIIGARFLDAKTGRAEGDGLRSITMRFQFLIEDT